jgi:hypothetical protein
MNNLPSRQLNTNNNISTNTLPLTTADKDSIPKLTGLKNMIPKSTAEEEKANASLTSLVNAVSSINETAAEEI